ncbi:hypothetical protein LXH09_05460 [Streptomyces sp. CS7]|uniref:hypothetical protein n=1 Tax=Streptomyces sp. CS-7 TaxID=2906769 RepID=UPI0021B253F2|nr:hypothetical protein [Streptomyces sp. CS-7]MCT6776070.1 hypothetical protein [Streptomyces sp. CS-7]
MTEIIASRLREQSENGAPREIELPLDVEEADRAADKAINFKLGTTTLSELYQHTRQLKGQVALFAGVMRNSVDVQGRASWLEAQHLLASAPSRGSLTFNSWLYARDLGRLLRRLVAEYREQLELDYPVLPTRTPRASLDRLTESRQTYLVPSGPAPRHRPMPVASQQ